MKKRITRGLFSENFLIYILVLLILPLALLCFYIHPSADDYIYSSWYKLPEGAHGYWSYQLWNYLSWNGRYFSTLLLTGNPLVFHSLTAYRFIPVFILCLFYTSIYFFLKSTLIETSVSKRHILSLLVTTTYFNLVPSLPESLYWMAGAVTYTLGTSLFLILTGFWVLYYKNARRTLIHQIIIAILIIVVAGFNELIAFMVLTLAFTIFVIRYKIHRKPDFFAISMFMLAVLLMVFITVAPGNKARLMQYENHYNLSYALMSTLKNTLKLAVYVFKNPSVLIMLLVLLLNAHSVPVKASVYSYVRKLILPLIVILSTGLTALFYFISAYNMGIEPPLRVHGFIILILLSGALAFVVLINNKGEIIKLPAALLKKVNRVLIFLYIFFLCGSFSRKAGEAIYFTGNIAQSVYDLTTTAPAFSYALESRYNIIGTTERAGDCLTVPALDVKPQSIYFTDIRPDSSHWINWGTALYFDVPCIKTVR